MTPTELQTLKQSILNDIHVMMQTTGQVTQYIGARYVPLFADPLDWSANNEYEPLTIVTNQGNSYTSRQFVPKGVELTNEQFWVETGNYNAQIEQYRQEVQNIKNSLNTKAPLNHASESTEYGIGNALNYGHVRLAVDDTPMNSDSNDGVAATPKMVQKSLGSNIISFKASSSEAYIGVPEVSSFAKGVARLEAPGIFVIQNNITIPSLKSGNKTIKGFQYYITHTYTETVKSDNNIFYDIVEWNTSYQENIKICSTFIFNCTAELFEKAGNQYIDLLIDLFSYELTKEDSNIPVSVTFDIVKLREYEKLI